MLRRDMFETDVMPRSEDTARDVFSYFWDTLYKPYPGLEARQPRSEAESEKLAESIRQFLSRGDRDGFLEWINKNSNLIQKRLRDVEGNSILLHLIKVRRSLARFIHCGPDQLLSTWREYIGLLIEYGPAEQLNLTDFKGQTPLMLRAEAGDSEMVALLLAKGADPDRQDYEGRTALQAAIKSGVENCVDILLDHPCSIDKLTFDRRSLLHTSTWSGNVHAVRRILAVNPKLAWLKDVYGYTPLELAERLLDEPGALASLTSACRANGVACATEPVLQEIIAILENAPTPG